jgi:hypothetical protein
MARPFSPATAEQMLAAVEAVVVNQKPTTPQFVSEFADLTITQAGAALELAVDIGFLDQPSGEYVPGSPLCRFIAAPEQLQKAAILRLLIESYEPFVTFRERYLSTVRADLAARQTKTVLDLDAHHEEIKATLLSLGTYAQALINEGPGLFRPEEVSFINAFKVLAEAAATSAGAESHIRGQIGLEISEKISRADVIEPLARALVYAHNGEARTAVVFAGNAFESFLSELATNSGINITGAAGIIQKLERFITGNKLPKKIREACKYIGQVRNAADHGVDPDHGTSWTISRSTGVEFVYVTCSMIAAAMTYTVHKTLKI